MATDNTGLEQNSPSEFATDDDQLVADLDPQIVSLLGRETVLGLEKYGRLLGSIGELVNLPSQFGSGGPNELDLSALSEEHRARIESLNPRAPRTRLVSNFQGHRAIRIADRYLDGFSERSKYVDDALNRYDEKLQARYGDYSQHPIAKGPLDFEMLAEDLKLLEQIAGQLPSQASLDTLTNVYAISKRDAAAKLRNLRYPSLARRVMNWTQDGVTSRMNVVGYRQRAIGSLRKRGGTLHRKTLSLAATEGRVQASMMLDTVKGAKGALAEILQQMPDHDISAIASAEEYLRTKVIFAEQCLSQFGLEKKSPALEEGIRQLGSTVLVDSVAERTAQERQDRAKPFSTQVTQAKEVLRGGGRLQNGKEKDSLREQADELHRLVDDETSARMLEPEESGVMIAILAGKFDGFYEVLARVQSGEGDEIVETVRQLRPEVMRELENFSLEAVLERIVRTLSDPIKRQEIDKILTHVGLREVEAKVSETLEQLE